MVTDLLLANLPVALLAGGLALMALEAVSPGAHLIVVGVALAGAGLIGLLFPGGLGIFVLAALTLAIGLAATWVYREFDFYGGKGTAQTSDSSSLAGATGYATEPITSRGGEVKLDDGGFTPYFSARTNGDRIEEGEQIIVLDPGGGNVLTVAAMNEPEQDEIDRALAREAATTGDDSDVDPTTTGSAQPAAARGENNTEPASETETETNSDSDSDSDSNPESETETEPSG